MSNPTKILHNDLSDDLQKIFNELKQIQGTYSTLIERFQNIDIDMLAEDEKKVIQDLIDAYHNDHKGMTSERIRNLETKLGGLTIDGFEIGDYEESFDYDTNGNVIKHIVSGDREVTTTYSYKDNGELTDSTKIFEDDSGNTIQIYKTYTYDENGNITGIVTKTTITPPIA